MTLFQQELFVICLVASVVSNGEVVTGYYNNILYTFITMQ
jgi:hypothetical protein